MLSYRVLSQKRGITSISSIGKNMDFAACHAWFKSNALISFITYSVKKKKKKEYHLPYRVSVKIKLS